jgi:regulator of protease activity HflC (stomatin/prohibitin superfamily)
MTTFRTRGGETGGEIFMTPPGNLATRAGILLLLIVGMVVLFAAATTVSTGHVGVMTRFGRVTGSTLSEGFHLKNPLDRVNELPIRTQELTERAAVPSNEGLIMTLDTSLIYRIRPESAAELFRTLGRRYVEVIIEPTLRSAIRAATAAHSANALYTGAREEVARQIQAEMKAQLGPRGIEVENVLLRDVQLPPTLKASIEAKQRAEQEALQMSFVLQKEKQEAERKRIEAQGVADYQRIVAQGLSPQILAWKGIEATEKIATSPNAKVIMIGRSNSGLPLVMEPK